MALNIQTLFGNSYFVSNQVIFMVCFWLNFELMGNCGVNGGNFWVKDQTSRRLEEGTFYEGLK